MEHGTIIQMSNGVEYHVPHSTEELLEILAHMRRLGEFPGLELTCECGVVWVNPEQVVSVSPGAFADEQEAAPSGHGWFGLSSK